MVRAVNARRGIRFRTLKPDFCPEFYPEVERLCTGIAETIRSTELRRTFASQRRGRCEVEVPDAFRVEVHGRSAWLAIPTCGHVQYVHGLQGGTVTERGGATMLLNATRRIACPECLRGLPPLSLGFETVA